MAGRPVRVLLAAGICALLACAAAVPAGAADLRALPSLSLEVERNSNVTNSATNESPDYIYRAIPKLTLVASAFHSSVRISGRFDVERYQHHRELDRNGATKVFNLTPAEPLQVTQRFSVRPGAGYVETDDAVKRNEITASQDPTLPASETLVTRRTKSREYNGSLGLTYLLTSTLEGTVGGRWVKRQFEEGSPELVDSQILSGNLSLSRRLSPRATAGFFFDTSYNSFSREIGGPIPNSRSYSAGISGSYVAGPRYNIEGRAGATYLLKKTGFEDKSTHDWSPYVRLTLAYSSLDFRVAARGSYEIAGASSAGAATKRGNVGLSLGDQFLQGWWWSLSGTYQTNRSTDEFVNEDTANASGTASIRYRVARWAYARLSGNVFRQWSYGAVGENLRRQSALLDVTFTSDETYSGE